jgi:hypothetical protein
MEWLELEEAVGFGASGELGSIRKDDPAAGLAGAGVDSPASGTSGVAGKVAGL